MKDRPRQKGPGKPFVKGQAPKSPGRPMRETKAVSIARIQAARSDLEVDYEAAMLRYNAMSDLELQTAISTGKATGLERAALHIVFRASRGDLKALLEIRRTLKLAGHTRGSIEDRLTPLLDDFYAFVSANPDTWLFRFGKLQAAAMRAAENDEERLVVERALNLVSKTVAEAQQQRLDALNWRELQRYLDVTTAGLRAVFADNPEKMREFVDYVNSNMPQSQFALEVRHDESAGSL